jgi:hypothetical protein
MVNRRDAVLGLLFGAGFVGLRSLESGIPSAILLDPRRAMAAAGDAGAAPTPITKPQYIIYSTSFNGDPVNCNALWVVFASALPSRCDQAYGTAQSGEPRCPAQSLLRK